MLPSPNPHHCLTWDMICFRVPLQEKRVPLQEKRVPLQEKRVPLQEKRVRFSTKKLPCNEVHIDSVGKYFVQTDYLPNYRIYDIQEFEYLNIFFSKVYNQKKSTSGIYQHRW